DARKATGVMEALLAEANKVADVRVLVSDWLQQYHVGRWFDASRPHAAIPNGADPAVFHPIGADRFAPGRPFRLVTHHWSDNWMKGWDIYREGDDLVASDKLPETELWVIGRWPKGIRRNAART